jgi:hypothetical protein
MSAFFLWQIGRNLSWSIFFFFATWYWLIHFQPKDFYIGQKVQLSGFFQLYFKVRSIASKSNKLKLQIRVKQMKGGFISTDCANHAKLVRD